MDGWVGWLVGFTLCSQSVSQPLAKGSDASSGFSSGLAWLGFPSPVSPQRQAESAACALAGWLIPRCGR